MGKKQIANIDQVQRTDSVYEMYYEPFLNPRRTSASRTKSITYLIRRRLYELAMNRFEWKGLPPEIDKRWMEMSLQDSALAVFYKDTDDGIMPRTNRFLAMRGSGSGNLNMLGNPTEYIVWGNGIYGTRHLSVDECVPIWANYTRVPDMDIINIYATRLAELDRTIEINSMNARQSKIFMMSQDVQMTVAQFNKQLEEGNNAIKVNDASDMTQMAQVLDLGIHPDQILNLSMLRGRIYNECMHELGINNNPGQDKKERLVASEVAGNDDQVAMVRESMLSARQEAAEQINRMFKLNVSVDFKTDHVTAELKDTSDSSDKKEVEN